MFWRIWPMFFGMTMLAPLFSYFVLSNKNSLYSSTWFLMIMYISYFYALFIFFKARRSYYFSEFWSSLSKSVISQSFDVAFPFVLKLRPVDASALILEPLSFSCASTVLLILYSHIFSSPFASGYICNSFSLIISVSPPAIFLLNLIILL